MLRKALIVATLTLAAPALAHTIWMVPEGDGWHVLFGGHAGAIDAYPAAKLRTVTAFAVNGTPLKVMRKVASDGVHLRFSGKPGVILAHYDNGIHTKRSNGPSVERPMHWVPNAISATRAIKYHKTIAAWSPLAAKPIGQPFEIVPLSVAPPLADTPMRVRVLIGGKPAAGIKIARNEEGADATTNAQGVASFTPARGFNKLWSGKRTPIQGNRAYTEDSIEYSLGFFAR